jgi:uncharacterized protein YqgC (DUF456 family)
VTGLELLCAAIMVVGLFGVVVQILPGTLLVLGAILLWATESQTGVGWAVLAIAVLATAAAWVGKYLLAGRGLKKAAVPNRSLVVGGIAGVVGFFAIPVIGLPLLFVLGIYLAEQIRLRDRHQAWVSTKAAIRATGITILVELAGAMIAVGAWAVAIAAT